MRSNGVGKNIESQGTLLRDGCNDPDKMLITADERAAEIAAAELQVAEEAKQNTENTSAAILSFGAPVLLTIFLLVPEWRLCDQTDRVGQELSSIAHRAWIVLVCFSFRGTQHYNF
jgi:hypothetical protein